MHKVVGLMRSNESGPWISTAGMKDPHLRVVGFGESMMVMMSATGDSNHCCQIAIIESDGLHRLAPANFMKIDQRGSKSVLCTIQSSNAL